MDQNTAAIDTPPPVCEACGCVCERGHAARFDPKTKREYDFRCLDCNQREYWQEYEHTRILRTKLLTDAAIEEVVRRSKDQSQWRKIPVAPELLTEVIAANRELRVAATRFEHAVWYNGLQPQVRACKIHGQHVATRKLKWLVWAGAGRCLITLEDPQAHHSLTLITLEDGTGAHMGVQGVEGKLAEVLELVDRAITIWQAAPHPRVVSDSKVRYLF